MDLITLTKDNFNNQLQEEDKPLLVDFWASWCGPCRMLSPIVDELAAEMSDSVRVGKVNIDENPELAEQFGVMSIPTLILFKDGEVVAQSVGVQPKADLITMIEENSK
ncbi:thioredoxin [Scatolibacter rhodanostii]|uniref:thioredoxin n=1 Tax=Scatolibacter rhodanostii TaxID=2014781 RepID=UPI000C06E32F|nr:thioredoxin [Scatolibacter rhodanostii]